MDPTNRHFISNWNNSQVGRTKSSKNMRKRWRKVKIYWCLRFRSLTPNASIFKMKDPNLKEAKWEARQWEGLLSMSKKVMKTRFCQPNKKFRWRTINRIKSAILTRMKSNRQKRIISCVTFNSSSIITLDDRIFLFRTSLSVTHILINGNDHNS